jgi:Flp pilus assembly pilin Flp
VRTFPTALISLEFRGATAAINRNGFPYLTMTRYEKAQGLVEYGLIIALVAVLAIAGLVIFGPAVSSLLSNLGGSV